MPQNPNSISKIRLVSDHTPTERIVFYCVHSELAGAKSVNFGIKNRVVAPRQNSNSSAPVRPDNRATFTVRLAESRPPIADSPFPIDIEPSAKLPYINGLAEHLRL